MASATFKIMAVATNGPWAYESAVDGVPTKVQSNLATLNAAMDAIKTDVAGMGLGPITIVSIGVKGT